MSEHGSPEGLFEEGVRARRAGQAEEAEKLWTRLLRTDPGHRDAAVALAFLRRERGDGEAAAEALRPLLAAASLPGRELVSLAGFLAELGATADALAALERAEAASPGEAAVALAHGRLLLQCGRFSEAEERLRRAFATDPEQAAAYYQWAQTRRWTGEEGARALRLLEEATRRARRSETLSSLGFARAKILDDLDRPAEAFASLHEANALKRATIPPFDHRFYEDWPEEMGPALPASPPVRERAEEDGEDLPRPLFVLGLPRSGTTLLARELARREETVLAGELDLLGRLAGRLGGPGGRARDYRRGLEALPAAERRAWARAYRLELRARGGRSARWAIDKNPLNFWHLPLLRTLFPHAPVFWCRRDRRDVLLSLYFQNFAHPALDFSYGLGDLRRHLALVARIEDLWGARMGDDVLLVPYETFVREPRTILDRADERLGAARKRARDESLPRIATASAWQARQEILGSRVGRWRRYAPFLLAADPELAGCGFDEEASDEKRN